MQSIRYEYEDIEVPERAIQEKPINSIYTGYENCKRKSKATEIMLENKLRERDIKYFKTILKKIVVYDFLDINKRIRRFIIWTNNKRIELRDEYNIKICKKKGKYKEAIEKLIDEEVMYEETK